MASTVSVPFDSVEAYVRARNGNRPIKKVLIANNGIGAVKAIRSMRRWAFETFGRERAVQFVVMATPEDMRANAEYIRMADEIVDVPGGSNSNNYANVMLVVEIAERWNVDAVWAGWGHASENPRLPNGLAKTSRNIVFIGPSGGPMSALGDKIGSTIIAQSAGVPCIHWNGDDLRINYKEDGIPPDVYAKANVTSAEQALNLCKDLGLPVMIKASEGGGGKGIRKVLDLNEVGMAYRQVASEVPGSPIFIMKLAPKSRHLEVQLLADIYGQAIALDGRDCSIQRRHQKIIEEGPPVVAPPNIWKQMEKAAISLAKEVGYSNAGTVEYLYTEEDKKFFFLELNPRLQVEHPVTEMITRVNLPAAQLQVSMGIPLHLIPDIRRLYGYDPTGCDPIDFENKERVEPAAHCIAVRITAENPDQGFQPTSGTIKELNFRSTPDVWGYFSVDSSGLVHEFADSQFGHLFAGGQDRESARKAMIIALKELSIRGNIRTTVEYIADLMSSEDFVQNRIDTSWLDARILSKKDEAMNGLSKDLRHSRSVEGKLAVTIGAVVTIREQMAQQRKEFCSQLEKGLVPPKELTSTAMNVSLIYEGTKYVLSCSQAGPQLFTVECGGSYLQAECRGLADGGYIIILRGKSFVVYTNNEPAGLRLSINGSTALFSKEYDPTCLDAEVAGKLARCLVPEGSHISAGSAYAEIEVMKMFMPVMVKESGTIHWALSEGATLQPGDRLATLQLDDPSSVTMAELYTGKLEVPLSDGNDVNSKNWSYDKPHLVLRSALEKLELVLWGYQVPSDQYTDALKDIKAAICDPLLPLHEFEEALSVISGRLDANLYSKLKNIADNYKSKCDLAAKNGTATALEFPVQLAMQILIDHDKLNSENDLTLFMNTTEGLRVTLNQYKRGVHGRTVHALVNLARQYLAVERGFSGSDVEEALQSLRRTHAGKEELPLIFDMYRSHLAISSKNSLLLSVLDDIRLACQRASKCGEEAELVGQYVGLEEEGGLLKELGAFIPVLTEIGNLTDSLYSSVAAQARALLIQQRTPSISQRKSALLAAISAAGVGGSLKAMDLFVNDNVPLRDLLLLFLADTYAKKESIDATTKAVEIYVRQTYRTYNIKKFSSESTKSICWCKWLFCSKRDEALPPGFTSSTSFVDLASFARTLSGLKLTQDTSADNVPESSYIGKIPSHIERLGAFLIVPQESDLSQYIEAILVPYTEAAMGGSSPVNVIHVALLQMNADSPSAVLNILQDVVTKHTNEFVNALIRRITFLVGGQGQDPSQPLILTFRVNRMCNGFTEDPLLRDIEPSNAHLLDLGRLSNFAIRLVSTVQATGGDVHLYAGIPTRAAANAAFLKESANGYPSRFFARVVSQGSELLSGGGKRYHVEKMFVEALSSIDLALAQADQITTSIPGMRSTPPSNNHIFINSMTPDNDVHPGIVSDHMKQLMIQFGDKIARLGVTHFEMKLICRLGTDSHPVPVRLVATNPTGFVVCVDTYVEAQEAGRDVVFRSIGGTKDLEWEGINVKTPYPVTRPFETRRCEAALRSDTLYCFDFLHLFESATQSAWREFIAERPQSSITMPTRVIHTTELVVRLKRDSNHQNSTWIAKDIDDLIIEEVNRPAGKNDVGMVAWLVTLRTPQFPEGRQLVLIANDITYQAGSFGTREDIVFLLASRYARSKGIPRLYLAANSGARIGMAESVKRKFKVAWQHDNEPALGYRYLYLEDEDYHALFNKDAVRCSRIADERSGEMRWRLMEIIGEEPDLGVENLRGSGAIAGETSLAYNDIFTLTLVVGRSVGIGAYLVRLGQRTIQNISSAPILLTGYQALNTLMGREVYTSNEQLGGGISVMFPNGVAHLLSDTHLDAVKSALKWLSYVPAFKGSFLPVQDIAVDEVERKIAFRPVKGATYDPRNLLSGHVNELDNEWVSGFFDRGSFTETLAGWAETVVCGRARLGGIPMGVIITENRTREKKFPADPADLTSQEKLVQQAGCVWFPDSAYKTAQAIRDFNGEDLPLMIFANWRGFSGGQRDMFNEILKFGALIVDALVAYKQPVFVYIPPFAELRGGAWVVVDSTINPEVMEMYAADDARGGVLEANGAASIKFRHKDIIAAAHRLDPILQSLDKQLKDCSDEEQKSILGECKQREGRLMGVYKQLAVQFADLHDTPGRMEATGAIRQMVPWSEARIFFYWRLRRKLAEFDLLRQVKEASKVQSGIERNICVDLKDWFTCMNDNADLWENDKMVLAWMAADADNIRKKIKQVEYDTVKAETEAMLLKSPEAVLNGILGAAQQFDAATKQFLLQKLGSAIGD